MNNFEDLINGIEVVNLSENDYFKTAKEEGDKEGDKLCKGWDYLRTHITPKLKEIALDGTTVKIPYNRTITQKVLTEIPELSRGWEGLIDSWVYLLKEKRNTAEKLDRIDKNFADGFNLITGLNKELTGKKILYRLKGSYDFLGYNKDGEGKLVEGQHGLMIIPKRSRTRGYYVHLQEEVYVKVV